MVDLDLNRPFYKVEVFEPDSTQPKLIFSPNIYLETERPTDDAQIASDKYVSHVTVNSKLDSAINTADIEIRHNIGAALGIDLDFKVKIYFGFYDHDKTLGPEFSLTYTGYVYQIKNGFEKTIVNCRSSLTKITDKETELTFSRMMGLNELMLIDQLAVTIGGLEVAQNGIYDPQINKQPGFGITKTQPLIEYIKKLAKYGGMFVFMNVDDKFLAQPWDPSSLQAVPEENSGWISTRNKTESENNNNYKHKIMFDETLIDIVFEMNENKYSGIEVVCLKPFSEEAVETIEPVKIVFNSSESSDSEKPLERYKLSHVTREDAEKIAENLFWRSAGKIYNNLKILNGPQIRVNDGIFFEGEIFDELPFNNLTFNEGSGEKKLSEVVFQVYEVQHKFDTVEGFVTNLKLAITHRPASGPASGKEVTGAEEEEEVYGEVVIEEEELEEEGEEKPIKVIVKTFRPDNEPIPNTDYILITPEGEEIEGTTGDDGTFTHEEMPRGAYELKFKEITEPGEEEE
jgi:hypothetical protein